jgi:glutamate N-acetyltransferase / amino-acid N-acetyltransferase
VKLPRRAHAVRVAGFRLAGVRAGFKTRGPDVALIVAAPAAVAAGVFTRNRAPAAPVELARARIAGGRVAAVVVNAGLANACTGAAGRRFAEATTAAVARSLGVAPLLVVPCSTGRLGVVPDERRMLRGVRAALAALSPDGFPDAAHAITTTDVFPKTAVRRLRLAGRPVTVAVLGKGAGMIQPDMATLLVFVLTDARLAPAAARRILRAAVAGTLNAVTVDGDTSTNDTVLLLASGAAGNPAPRGRDEARLTQAVTEALGEIARLVVLDGEGAARIAEIVVRGAASDAEARRAARAIGNSILCKAALHGADPNWGRFIAAAGNARVRLDPERTDVSIGGVAVARRGRGLPGAQRRARARMRRPEVEIALDLHLGRGTGRILASDLSVAYVRFNAEYTT